MPRHYTLSAQLIAAHAGGPVVCLDTSATGRTFRAYSRRPGPDRNRSARAMLAEMRAEYGDDLRIVRAEPEAPQNDVLVVAIEGPIEQRAGQHEPSGSWVDGHDAIYDRLAAAFEVGDVVLIGDSPGGVVVGGPENIRRAQEMKMKHGRRCIGFTEAGAFSMAFWWMAAICDEIFVSRDGRLGSIGARGMLASISGALAKDGIAVEIVEDPDGKAAGAPEQPISDEARARAQRDVTAAADMFRAAVAESAIGQRNGLTPDALKAMRGDTYQGQNAVAAGLADGVSSLEDVLAYALATAGGEGAAMDPDKDEKKPKDDDGRSAEHEPMKCTRCGEESPEDARFCAKCGAKVAEEDEPPPSSQRKPHPEPDEDDKSKAVATRYGSASVPALRTACITMHRTLDAVAGIVGAKSHEEILGAVKATATDAAQAIRYRRERDDARASAERKERRDLAMRLIGCNVEGWSRGDVFADVKGEKFTAAISEMSLPTLRGMVERFEANRKPSDPFQPDRDRAKAAEEQAKIETKPNALPPSGEPTDAQIAAAMNLDAVKAIVKQTGRDPKMVARTYLKTAAQNGAMHS